MKPAFVSSPPLGILPPPSFRPAFSSLPPSSRFAMAGRELVVEMLWGIVRARCTALRSRGTSEEALARASLGATAARLRTLLKRRNGAQRVGWI
jgi:hypothetical protein